MKFNLMLTWQFKRDHEIGLNLGQTKETDIGNINFSLHLFEQLKDEAGISDHVSLAIPENLVIIPLLLYFLLSTDLTNFIHGSYSKDPTVMARPLNPPVTCGRRSSLGGKTGR